MRNRVANDTSFGRGRVKDKVARYLTLTNKANPDANYLNKTYELDLEFMASFMGVQYV